MVDKGVEPSSPAEVFVEDQRTTKQLVKLLRHANRFIIIPAQELMTTGKVLQIHLRRPTGMPVSRPNTLL